MENLVFPHVPGMIVSIHDVRPGTRERVAGILRDLAGLGVFSTSLLVIPNWHGRDPLLADREFGTWLANLAGQGHELVLHGYHHLRSAGGKSSQGSWTGPGGLWTHVVTSHYTAGEGEFYDLEQSAAKQLLEAGKKELAECAGVSPEGFIAPAWLLGKEAEAAVWSCGFRYTTRIGEILCAGKPGAAPRVYPSRSLCYSVRAPWRRACSLAWNTTLLAWLEGTPLVRIGIHPPDWTYPEIRGHILNVTKRALAGRPPISYQSWLKEQSAPSHP